MAWCEANRVDYVFGLARNKRLSGAIEDALAAAAADSRRTGKPARRYQELVWTTRKSWSRERRVVAKAEWTHGKANPRFVVTSLGTGEVKARRLYEKVYCARGDMENRIKECQRPICSPTALRLPPCGPTSCACGSPPWPMRCSARCAASPSSYTPASPAPPAAPKLLKIGAQVRRSVRRVKFAMASSFPYQQEYAWLTIDYATPPADPSSRPPPVPSTTQDQLQPQTTASSRRNPPDCLLHSNPSTVPKMNWLSATTNPAVRNPG